MADAPHYWHFVNMRIWPRLVEGVGILRGIEANIKNTQGEIDCTGPMLNSLDLIIAGFTSRCSLRRIKQRIPKR
jgi:putative hydrolase